MASFLDVYEPLRSELYRYCRHLTRSAWDAEDLAQDTMARAFATLGRMGQAPPNLRTWLFRVASNRWIDQMRKAREANRVLPFDASLPNTATYLERLIDRPSFQRVRTEAEPYFAMFPSS